MTVPYRSSWPIDWRGNWRGFAAPLLLTIIEAYDFPLFSFSYVQGGAIAGHCSV